MNVVHSNSFVYFQSEKENNREWESYEVEAKRLAATKLTQRKKSEKCSHLFCCHLCKANCNSVLFAFSHDRRLSRKGNVIPFVSNVHSCSIGIATQWAHSISSRKPQCNSGFCDRKFWVRLAKSKGYNNGFLRNFGHLCPRWSQAWTHDVCTTENKPNGAFVHLHLWTQERNCQTKRWTSLRNARSMHVFFFVFFFFFWVELTFVKKPESWVPRTISLLEKQQLPVFAR